MVRALGSIDSLAPTPACWTDFLGDGAGVGVRNWYFNKSCNWATLENPKVITEKCTVNQ